VTSDSSSTSIIGRGSDEEEGENNRTNKLSLQRDDPRDNTQMYIMMQTHLFTQDASVGRLRKLHCHSNFSASAATRIDFCIIDLQLHVDEIATG